MRHAPKIPVLAKQRQEDFWGVASQSSQVYKLQLQGDLLSKIYWFGSHHSLELVGVCGKTKTSKLALLLQTDYCPAPLLILTTLTELTLCICVVFLWTLYSSLWVNLSILELKTILLITPALQEVLLIYKGTHAYFKNSLSNSKGTKIGQNFD